MKTTFTVMSNAGITLYNLSTKESEYIKANEEKNIADYQFADLMLLSHGAIELPKMSKGDRQVLHIKSREVTIGDSEKKEAEKNKRKSALPSRETSKNRK